MNSLGGFPDDLLAQFKQDYAERMDKSKMPCNKPRQTPSHSTKKSIVKGCENGQEKVIRFGDQHMSIKKHIPERRANFRARHNCDEKKSKLSAGYWSCRAW